MGLLPNYLTSVPNLLDVCAIVSEGNHAFQQLHATSPQAATRALGQEHAAGSGKSWRRCL